MKQRSDLRLQGPLALAEEIAARDLNNLYLTSRYFADPERYKAFCALYAVMRVVDDRIDEIPSRSALDAAARQREHAVVDAWLAALETALRDGGATDEQIVRCDSPSAGDLLRAAGDAMQRFPVPFVLWRNFFAAMHQDLESSRFSTYDDFLTYTEGASVAPTTIYLYLTAASRPAPGQPYRPPRDFELIECGHHLGLFAYLGHILRDLTVDLATGDEGLLYLAGDDMAAHGVDLARLHRDSQRRRASEPVRALVRTLVQRSRRARDRGRELMRSLEGALTGDCAFILELIVTIYEAVIDKIVASDYDPMAGRHRLTLEEKTEIAMRTAARVGYSPALP